MESPSSMAPHDEPPQDTFRLSLLKLVGLVSTLAGSCNRLLRDAAGRRRLAIVLAAAFVTLYAAGVFGYVLSIPDIGLRCAFTPVVNRVYRDFLYPDAGEPGARIVGDTITQIADQKVDSWPQVL